MTKLGSRIARDASRVVAMAAALWLARGACGGQTGWWPEDRPAAQAPRAGRVGGPAGWFMGLYSNYISQVDGVRTCVFEPTCGAYCRQAIRRHGALLGWLMGCERSIRYHRDTTTYRRAIVEGHLRLLDPVGDNDFWLRRPFRRKHP